MRGILSSSFPLFGDLKKVLLPSKGTQLGSGKEGNMSVSDVGAPTRLSYLLHKSVVYAPQRDSLALAQKNEYSDEIAQSD